MKYFQTFFILLILLTSSLPAQQNRYSVIDDLGREIYFDKIPERIITLAPSLTEFIYALKCHDRLIGNTTYCNYPPESKEVRKVGDMLTFDYELILSLNPDLIIITVEGNTKETYDKLNELGLKTFIVNPRNLGDIKEDFLLLAGIFKKEEFAQNIINTWSSDVEEIVELNQKRESYSVMIVVELNPLMLAGTNTFLNEYLEICNLNNITGDSPLNYPVYSREEIIKRNPDFIIYPSGGSEDEQYLLDFYPEWEELDAFKKGHVVFVNRDMYFRPGPRFVESLKDLSRKIR